MKKLWIVTLCLALTAALLAGCSGNGGTETDNTAAESQESSAATQETAGTTEEAYSGIAFNGLHKPDFTQDEVVAAEGREADITSPGDDGSTTMIYRDEKYFGFSFEQVQYTIYSDHTQITCCYTIAEGEVLADVLASLKDAVSAQYGDGTESTTSGGSTIVSWSDAVSNNRIRLYAITDSEIRLQFTMQS